MVKVLTGVQPGQVTDAQAESIATAPIDQLQSQTPQATTTDDFRSWLESTPEVDTEALAAGVEAGAEQELALQEQREREAVPDIITRRDEADSRVDAWDREGKAAAAKANDGPQTDGGLADRARNMADKYTAVDPETGRTPLYIGGLSAAAAGPMRQVMQAAQAINEDGQFNRDFLQMSSVITENHLAQTIFSKGEEGVTQEDVVLPDEVEGQSSITKAQGNKALGDAIYRDYMRFKNKQAGLPTDQYNDLPPEQATLLGDVAKEMYYEANKSEGGKQIMTRGSTPDGQVAFTVTKHGADRFAQGAATRKRMFPKQHVRPSKQPLPRGQLVGEGRKYTKRASGRVGKQAGAEVISQAMANLNKVANVVDPQRLKILYATALPVLTEQVTPDSPLAKINHVGKDKIDKLNAKYDNNQEIVAAEYAGLVDSLAQSLFGIATERKGANYLTYYMQSFNGRIAPQQTNFDPTTSKTTRFVTRNAIPADTSNPRIERNLRQMYAMMLVSGADALLPAGREAALEKATPQLVRWGKELRAAFNQISDAQVEAVSEAIANGVPINDPNFPKLPDVSQGISDTLAKQIAKKGEDGQHFIDGVMDFTDYYEKKLKGRPHHSYFNAYMDGKTNGLASNGIQMGSEQVAYKTGVIRSQDETLLDNDKDIRDDLADTLVNLIDSNGFDGSVGDLSGPLHNVATKLFNGKDDGKISRNLHKATTMTFGYGKELASFKQDIEGAMDEMAQADPDFASDLQTLVQSNQMGREQLVDTLHGKYVEGLANALDPNALKSRAIMRSAAYLFALSNELFTIESATGFELAIGGTELTEWSPIAEYKVGTGDALVKRVAGEAGREVTSAAIKSRADAEAGTEEREVGGYAYGGAVPAPVQSLDAATVALTATGKSWDKLRAASQGAPYLHTIYDAFKVDAMGYDVVLNEVNKNWLDAGMNWSYLEETRAAVDGLRKKFQEKFGNRSNNEPLTEPEARQLQWFMEMHESQKGTMYPKNLFNKMDKLIEVPTGVDVEGAREMGGEAAKRIWDQMKKAGWNEAKPTVGHLKTFMKAFNDELQISPRLGRMINETNANKAKLAEKIKRDGAKVYQYYAH